MPTYTYRRPTVAMEATILSALLRRREYKAAGNRVAAAQVGHKLVELLDTCVEEEEEEVPWRGQIVRAWEVKP